MCYSEINSSGGGPVFLKLLVNFLYITKILTKCSPSLVIFFFANLFYLGGSLIFLSWASKNFFVYFIFRPFFKSVTLPKYGESRHSKVDLFVWSKLKF